MDRHDRPYTHEQYKSRTGDEPECDADDHNYVDCDGGAVCARCGDVQEWSDVTLTWDGREIGDE